MWGLFIYGSVSPILCKVYITTFSATKKSRQHNDVTFYDQLTKVLGSFVGVDLTKSTYL